MPAVRFRYELRKARNTRLAPEGYKVELQLRESGRPESLETIAEEEIDRISQTGDFRVIITAGQLLESDVRLRITRLSLPGSPLVTHFRRLRGPVSAKELDLGTYKFFDNLWAVSGTVAPFQGFPFDPDALRGVLEVRSGTNYEKFVELDIGPDGAFSFSGPRMFIEPGKTFDIRVRVLDQQGVELGRYYALTRPGDVKNDVRIRVGQPFLNVWREFQLTHPGLAGRLENVFRYNPKKAHRTGDAFRALRRYRIENTHQVAEGVVTRSKKGPIGDPDWVWNVKLDQLYDSPDGFQLPNEKNRTNHGGLHVEACRSLSKAVLEDGVRAQRKDNPVPVGTRVWMLGTHVFDDTRDFGSPDHEHFELHPLYVMQPCMGGWFHFAVFESIAVAPQAAEVTGVGSRDWPWTSTDPAAYREAYKRPEPKNRSDPHAWRNEISTSYEHICGRLREKDPGGLASFFADTSLRYDSLGVDLGAPGMPTRADYRKWARDQINAEHPEKILEALIRRLMALFRFLYGPASFGLNPVRGPAPHSILRCVYAKEARLASEITSGAVGEQDARVSANRATSKRSEDVRKDLGELHGVTFDAISDAAARGRAFAEAIQRYRNWAVRTSRASESWPPTRLREFGSSESVDSLTSEVRARVNRFWKLLTPHRAR